MSGITRENDADPARAPTESGGVTRDEVAAVAPMVRAAATAASSPAAAATPEPAPALGSAQRSVDLPARPRLRISFWFDADKLKCEALMATEGRTIVHRTPVPADGDTVARIYAFFANLLSADLKAGGALVNMPAPAPAAEAEPTTARDGGSSQ